MIEAYRYVRFNGPSYLTLHCNCQEILLVQTFWDDPLITFTGEELADLETFQAKITSH